MEASGSGGTSGEGGSGAPQRFADSIQKAIDELRTAGEKATGDVRSNIDDAIKRLREVSGEAGSKAQDQLTDFRQALEQATEDVRKELGKLAVRAQTSKESLEELARELDERRKSLGDKGDKDKSS